MFTCTVGNRAVTIDVGGFNYLRGLINYVAFLTAYIAFYNYIWRYGFPWHIFIYLNIIWLLMGMIEVAAPEITEAVSKRRTTDDRGVTSLAPEPTFFAIYLFFNSWLMLAASAFRPDWRLMILVIVNGAAIILLAKATMGALFILIAAGAVVWYKLSYLRLKIRETCWLFVGVLSIIVLIVFGGVSLEESRITKIYFFLSETSIMELIRWDASINQRLESAVLSLHGAWYNGLCLCTWTGAARLI